MADVTKEIALKVVATDATGPALESLEDKLNAAKKRMVELAAAGKQNTEEFQRLQVEAGGYKRTIEGVEQSVDSFAKGGTKALTLMVQASQAVAAGFQVAQGAAALFGDENEDLQKAMLKVQGAIALANGVQQVANLLQKESALMMGINTLATKTYAAVVGDATEKTRIFRIALAGLGLAGIIVVVGLIAEALGLFSEKTKDAADAQKDLKRSLEDTVGTLEYYERKLKANGATEADLAKLRRQTLLNEEAELKRKLQEELRLYGVRNDKYQNSLRQELDLLNIKIKEESKIINDAAKQESDKTTQTANELLAIQKKYKDQLATLNADALNKELIAIDQKYEADLAKLKKHGKDTADLEAIINKEKEAKRQEFADKEFDIIFAGLQAEANAEQAYLDGRQAEFDKFFEEYFAAGQAQVEADKKFAEQRKAIEKSVADYKKEVVTDSITAIGQILSAFGNENKGLALAALAIEKGAAIANVIINLQKEMAANAALAAANPANIATAGAAGIAQAKALNTLAKVRAGLRIAAITAAGIQAGKSIMGGGDSVGGGGGGGMMPTGTGGGGGATNAPAVFGNPNVTDLSGFGAGQGQGMQPMRAYVVERDIQQTTSRVRRLSEFATLG